jgi:hypothetical protein
MPYSMVKWTLPSVAHMDGAEATSSSLSGTELTLPFRIHAHKKRRRQTQTTFNQPTLYSPLNWAANDFIFLCEGLRQRSKIDFFWVRRSIRHGANGQR